VCECICASEAAGRGSDSGFVKPPPSFQFYNTRRLPFVAAVKRCAATLERKEAAALFNKRTATTAIAATVAVAVAAAAAAIAAAAAAAAAAVAAIAASRRENGTIGYYRDPQTGVIILKAATLYNGRKFPRGETLPRKVR